MSSHKKDAHILVHSCFKGSTKSYNLWIYFSNLASNGNF